MRLWKSAYERARNDLKAEIVASFKSDAQAQGHPDTPSLTKWTGARADQMLADFERLADKRTYRSGVWQSFWGAWLYVASLGAITAAVYLSNLDFREMVKGYFAPHRPPEGRRETVGTPPPSPSAAPSASNN